MTSVWQYQTVASAKCAYLQMFCIKEEEGGGSRRRLGERR
jgi:hypothetical protein